MAEKSLNCKWISRHGCHGGSRSAKNIEACALRRIVPVGCKYSSVAKSLFFQKLMLEMSAVVLCHRVSVFLIKKSNIFIPSL